jgi:hypothetical protein
MIISDWNIIDLPQSPYTAPECRIPGMVLHGFVADHPLGQNTHITTSVIKKIEGRRVYTHSGSCYILAGPTHSWISYMFAKGWDDTEENPVPVEGA